MGGSVKPKIQNENGRQFDELDAIKGRVNIGEQVKGRSYFVSSADGRGMFGAHRPGSGPTSYFIATSWRTA